jgi:AcrR family transcriptional regulator
MFRQMFKSIDLIIRLNYTQKSIVVKQKNQSIDLTDLDYYRFCHKYENNAGPFMPENPSTIEEKIISAAIECMERYGIQGTTNRRIAEIAGVNSAAINYYFRSKDALIDRCMAVTLENAFDMKDFEKLPAGSARERCAAIFEEIIDGGCRYPGLTRAHFYELLARGNYEAPVAEKLNDFIENLAEDLAARGMKLDKDELRLACIQTAAASMMLILTPRLFAGRFGVDMNEPAVRKKFVKRLVDRLF